MATPLINLREALRVVTDENGFIPFVVAKFAATASAVEISFEHEYEEVCTLCEKMGYNLGIEAQEFAEWLEEVTEK